MPIVLRAADLERPRGAHALLIDLPASCLLYTLAAAREALVRRLDALEPEDFARKSQHPRLGTDMRLVDLLFFTAEHDDHHLAEVTVLLEG